MNPNDELLASELESQECGGILCISELLELDEDFFRRRRDAAELEIFADFATPQDGRAALGDLEVEPGLIDV